MGRSHKSRADASNRITGLYILLFIWLNCQSISFMLFAILAYRNVCDDVLIHF